MGGLGRLLPALLLVAVAGACADTGAPAPTGQSPAPGPTTSIEYAAGLTADLYLPEDLTRVPLVVMVPGGGWVTADPAGFAGLAAALADAGVAAAPTHIRAAVDEVTYPAPVEDVLCAVAAAAEELGARGGTAGPLVVLGHSSGAHLAALAVLATGDFAPTCDAPLVTPDALIGLSGPYDLGRVPDLAVALLGSGPDDDPDAWAAADPVARAGLRPDVPVLLLHGEDDDIVPVDFTTQFADALTSGGHPTTVDVVAGADHVTIFAAEVAAERIVRWLDELPAA